MERQSFHIFSVGWELVLIRSMTGPVGDRTGIRFTHGIVGDGARLPDVRAELPGFAFIALSKANGEPLPPPDHELLASLEAVGVPTIRTMIQGDRVLRYRSETESLGYATLLARKIGAALDELDPDVVLGSFDGLHAALSLAVARSRGIPWVAMTFTVIPDSLTAFCRGVTPDTLVGITRPKDEALQRQAEEIIRGIRSKRQKIMAYRPPASLRQRARQLIEHTRNFGRRLFTPKELGFDRFTYPAASERFADIVRRSVNHMRLPARKMLMSPPEGRFAFFPLHMVPESSIDTWAPFYQDQLAFIMQVSLALPADLEFVVKIHFSDHDNYSHAELRRLLQLPRLRIAHPNASSHAFLERSTLVVAIQGTASLEAALFGKPVLLFGASPYQDFPRTQRAERPDALHEQIRRMLEIPAPRDEEIVEAFTAYLARYMPGRVNDWSKPIDAAGIDHLASCFAALRSYVEAPGNRDAWYAQPPFTGAARVGG